MATTRIIPLHLNKGKTLAQCLSDRTDYAKNPEKTDDGSLISSYACDPAFVASEFALSKKEYRQNTGRVQENDVIAYQLRQSFKPGEVTPEEANRIGYEFAERFTKGDYAFIVCTHIDKAHIHNHIIWNSTALDCTRKFRNFWGSTEAVRKLSDQICTEHRLSVIENPKEHGVSYDTWLGTENKLSNRDLLKMAIDRALQKHPKDMDELTAFLKADGYQVRTGKHLAFRLADQKQFIRLRSLGEGYSEDELRAVMQNGKEHKPFVKRKYPKRQQRTTLVSELEAKINSGKGARYDQAMKVIKLKQMAKTFVFLEEHGYANLAELSKAASDAEAHFYDLKASMKAAEVRIVEIETLRTHLNNYYRTLDVFKGYKQSKYSKAYLAEHEGDIILHRTAKKAFNELGLTKLPSRKDLSAESSRLKAEKSVLYAEYRKAQDEMRELMIHKANAEYVLGLDEQKHQKEVPQYE